MTGRESKRGGKKRRGRRRGEQREKEGAQKLNNQVVLKKNISGQRGRNQGSGGKN